MATMAQPLVTQARDEMTMATSLRDVVERMWSLPPGWPQLLCDAFGGLPQLPPDWQVRVSREHGLPYYANKELRCTQWRHPGLPDDVPIPPEVAGLKRVWRQLQEERAQRAAAEVAQRQAAADAARCAILDRLEDVVGPTALFAKVRHVQAILRVRCPFIRAVWRAFDPMRDILQLQLPTSVGGFLYDPVALPFSAHKSTIRALWPILRACVWYSLWLERNNRVFRTTLTPLPAAALAIKAATITRLHIRHLARRAVVPSLAESLHALRADPWRPRYLIPHSIPSPDHAPSA
ncbi:hypothetical protein SDRG_09774 [Saprolegnia diclina VS20]|uniref:WW domain-containing protein n=1 Tax=Saprolegnia diclina (strain VS20) TaxID=1156394 RepID=T0RQR5_SAPDV|nr:hypothetical protein SDRG_09774 [Saprolegnia diclina VS20]EQC32447.1 hypothetical protein SDRG_09774 [Saprolegnia diclina VS20]|eukprot:XP_008613948.1 hypothetical protein SDRG_09774 [Saprolegnia diclina VS20]